MAGKKTISLGTDWEDSIIRESLVRVGDFEGVREFDEEKERMRREAEAEIEEMRKAGLLLV